MGGRRKKKPRKRKIRRILASLLMGGVTQDFLDNFVGGEVRVRKGEEYCYQGVTKSVTLVEGKPKKIVIVFNWVAERSFPIFKRKKPLGKEDNYGWILRKHCDGYEMTIFMDTIFDLKKNHIKTLGVLGPDDNEAREIVRFMQAGNKGCIAEKLGLASKKVEPPTPEVPSK